MRHRVHRAGRTAAVHDRLRRPGVVPLEHLARVEVQVGAEDDGMARERRRARRRRRPSRRAPEMECASSAASCWSRCARRPGVPGRGEELRADQRHRDRGDRGHAELVGQRQRLEEDAECAQRRPAREESGQQLGQRPAAADRRAPRAWILSVLVRNIARNTLATDGSGTQRKTKCAGDIRGTGGRQYCDGAQGLRLGRSRPSTPRAQLHPSRNNLRMALSGSCLPSRPG